MPADVPFSCTCGQVHGVVRAVSPRSGNHVTCYCTSCQTAANVLGDTAALDPYGGTTVFQTVPSRVRFDAGADRLAVLKLSPKGMLRWHAGCCGAALFTMPEAAWFPLAGLNTARVAPEDRLAFGPIAGIHQAQGARNPPAGLKTWGMKRAFAKLAWRALWARLQGDKGKPFFTEDGQVSVTPRVLTLAERKSARPT